MPRGVYKSNFIKTFDLVIESTPEYFSDWCQSELKKTYPIGLNWSKEISNLSLYGNLYAPMFDYPNHLFIVDGYKIDENYRWTSRINKLITFEIRIVTPEVIHIICICLEHEPLIEYLLALEGYIEDVFDYRLPRSYDETRSPIVEVNDIVNQSKNFQGRKPPLQITKDTVGKIYDLIRDRKSKRESCPQIPPWTSSCRLVGIWPKTATRVITACDPLLRTNWTNTDYDEKNFVDKFCNLFPMARMEWDLRESGKL